MLKTPGITSGLDMCAFTRTTPLHTRAQIYVHIHHTEIAFHFSLSIEPEFEP